MALDKQISPKEAGIAVLKKFCELLIKAEKDKSMKKSEKLEKDESAPAPTVGDTATAGGTKTINSQIGFPFGKAENHPEWEAKRINLRDAKGIAEHKKKAAYEKLAGPMDYKQFENHLMFKKPEEYSAPKGKKHQDNLKDFHIAHEEHKNAIKAYKDHISSDNSGMHKSEPMNMAMSMNEKQEGSQEQNPSVHPDHTKGHYKLAKFVGRVEGKKAAKGMNQDSGNDTPTQSVDNVGPTKNDLDKGEGLTSKPDAAGKHGLPNKNVKGVHQPHVNSVANNPGGSAAGFQAEMAAKGLHPKENAREMHSKKLDEQKAMKKPNLPK